MKHDSVAGRLRTVIKKSVCLTIIHLRKAAAFLGDSKNVLSKVRNTKCRGSQLLSFVRSERQSDPTGAKWKVAGGVAE